MAAADKLGGAIRAVQAEKVRMDIERRKVQAQGWNQKAQRLVRRLEDCDAVSVRQTRKDLPRVHHDGHVRLV